MNFTDEFRPDLELFSVLTDGKLIRLGDPINPNNGHFVACDPYKQCQLTPKYDGNHIFKWEKAIGAKDVFPILEKNSISLESVKFPGFYMVERSKNGKRIIMLGKVDRNSEAHSKFSIYSLIYLFTYFSCFHHACSG